VLDTQADSVEIRLLVHEHDGLQQVDVFTLKTVARMNDE